MQILICIKNEYFVKYKKIDTFLKNTKIEFIVLVYSLNIIVKIIQKFKWINIQKNYAKL